MNSNVIQVKTVIIGAGISGLSAGFNLLNHNYNDFIIFEALERIGGRVHTHTDNKGYLEIGAQWIHGQDGNPLYETAKKHNLLLEGFEKTTSKHGAYENTVIKPVNNYIQSINISREPENIMFITQYGVKITLEFAQSVYDTLTRLISEAESLNLDRTSNNDNRVGDYLYDRFVQIVKTQMATDLNQSFDDLTPFDVKRLLSGLFLMRIKRENIRSGCSNVYDLSLRNFSTYKEFPGHSYVELKYGYGPVINAFIGPQKDALLSRIKLTHYVKKIILHSSLCNQKPLYDKPEVHSMYTNDKRKAVLIMCDASDPEKPRDFVVVCDQVLCTMSLGCLKENLNTLIEPISLISDERRESIRRLGFGTINKIFLFYEEPFWSSNVQLMNVIWLPEKDFHMEKIICRNSTKRIWYEDICKFEVVRSYPNAISAWLSGSEEFEKYDDKVVAGECTRILRKFLDNQNIPEPKSIIRTKWNTNRFSRGSYSHLPFGSKPSDYEVLAQPIPSVQNPIILFAGEATHSDYFSTVHGAFLTGVRESERILMKQKFSRL